MHGVTSGLVFFCAIGVALPFFLKTLYPEIQSRDTQ